MTKAILTISIFALFALAFGCNPNQIGVVSDKDPIVPKKLCTVDLDCSGGFGCREGKCVPICKTTSDCTANEVCNEFVCKSKCAKDADCKGADSCVDTGYCEPMRVIPIPDPPPECTKDEDCKRGNRCAMGECIPTAIRCRDDRECHAKELCVSGGCKVACKKKTERVDCPENTFCIGNSSASYCAKASCGPGHDPCPQGYGCARNICQKIACVTRHDCIGEETCFEGFCTAVDMCRDVLCDKGRSCYRGACYTKCRADNDCITGKCSVRQLCE